MSCGRSYCASSNGEEGWGRAGNGEKSENEAWRTLGNPGPPDCANWGSSWDPPGGQDWIRSRRHTGVYPLFIHTYFHPFIDSTTFSSIHLSVHLSSYLPIDPSVHPPGCPSLYSSTSPPINKFIGPPTHPSVHPPSIYSSSMDPYTHELTIHPSIYSFLHSFTIRLPALDDALCVWGLKED